MFVGRSERFFADVFLMTELRKKKPQEMSAFMKSPVGGDEYSDVWCTFDSPVAFGDCAGQNYLSKSENEASSNFFLLLLFFK